MPHANGSELEIPDRPQCDPQPIRIIHVGMGASGMLAAYKARRTLSNFELVCYEKNSNPGGTWFENKYPGCACDIPAHIYTLPFEGNPDWSGYYAYSPEILAYFMRFYEKHDLAPFCVLNTEVVDVKWNDLEGKWHVQLKRSDGTELEDICDVFINGSGVLTKWKWPAIEGLHDFKGTLVHTASWPQGLEWKGKRVAIIGSGSSSIQLLPKLAETASHVTVLIRNQTYISPQMGGNVTNEEADSAAANPAAAGKHQYTELEKKRFRQDPEYHRKYRERLEKTIMAGWEMFYRGGELNLMVTKVIQDQMKERLGGRDDLKERIIPTWSAGCRRLTPGEGYLEALIKPNVSVIWGDVERITPKGLVVAGGEAVSVDILACATGFTVQYLPHFRITGLGGQIMQEQSKRDVYASVAVPGFPNYFVVNGPRGNWGQGCALPSHEVQVEYILQCCRKMQEDQIKSMHPKAKVTKQLNDYMDAWHNKHSIWAEDCKSWYKENEIGGRVHIWSGSLPHHIKYMKHPRYEHYEIEYKDPDNIFVFLGNGRTISQVKYGADAPVPWIRNQEDASWDIE